VPVLLSIINLSIRGLIATALTLTNAFRTYDIYSTLTPVSGVSGKSGKSRYFLNEGVIKENKVSAHIPRRFGGFGLRANG